jgi:8-oxo-dGTP diphosphatase
MKQVVAALILREPDEVLICQRTKHQPMPLKWEFPGGKIERGETSWDALKRELDEELGVNAKIGDEVARFKHFYKNGGAVELRFFIVREFQGELENRIFKDIRWVKRSELPDYNFLDADTTLIKDIAAGKVI